MKNRPKGLKYNIKVQNSSWFKKGSEPYNKNTSKPEEEKEKIRSSVLATYERRSELKDIISIRTKEGMTQEVIQKMVQSIMKGREYAKDSGYGICRKLYPILPDKCEECNRVPKHKHHKNSNPLNNSPENVQFLCNSCHRKKHITDEFRRKISEIAKK